MARPPTELELIALETEFDLYLPFTKRLVLDLPSAADRVRAALWLKKLMTIEDDNFKKLRNEHTKLFLFALHRRSLVGIFEKKPPKDDLESFHDGLTLLEMTRELIEITEQKKTEAKKEGEEGFGICPLPPVLTHISHDLKEYAAYQRIPKFGSHCYYAISKNPIQLWTKPAGSFPDIGEPPNQLKWEIAMSKVSDNVLVKQAEVDAALEAQKQAEIGFVFAEAEPEVKEEEEQMEIEPCGSKKKSHNSQPFKWKKDSKLNFYQSYDFSDIGKADDLQSQGIHQLELDEDAMDILDQSLPGRKRVVIREPFLDGLPDNILERRVHGVVSAIPEMDDDDDGETECEEDEECDLSYLDKEDDDNSLQDDYSEECCAPIQQQWPPNQQIQNNAMYNTGGYGENNQQRNPNSAMQVPQFVNPQNNYSTFNPNAPNEGIIGNQQFQAYSNIQPQQQFMGNENLQHQQPFMGNANLQHQQPLMGNANLQHQQPCMGNENLQHQQPFMGNANLQPQQPLMGNANLQPQQPLMGNANLQHQQPFMGNANLQHQQRLMGNANLQPQQPLMGNANLQPQQPLMGNANLQPQQTFMGNANVNQHHVTFNQQPQQNYGPNGYFPAPQGMSNTMMGNNQSYSNNNDKC